MKSIPFVKMHGAGNDYVYINCFETPINFLGDINQLAICMSDRHFGVGSDGIVLILPSDNGANLQMRMFNSDGSEAQMCGNASRCVAKFAYEHGIVKTTDFILQTKAGNKEISINANGSVTVNMGCYNMLSSSNLTIFDTNYDYLAVSMGNPHCVIFVDNVDSFPVQKVGSQIEKHPNFPEKTNVEFAHPISNDAIEMRVWERGAGETLACGTGACATMVAAYIKGLTANKATLKLRGGNLEISLNTSTNCVYMTGSAETVFYGEYFCNF